MAKTEKIEKGGKTQFAMTMDFDFFKSMHLNMKDLVIMRRR